MTELNMSLNSDLNSHETLRPRGKIKAVIFDMDGLMIDSEPFHRLAFDSVFRRFGKELTEEENMIRYVGISDLDAAKDMVTRFNLPLEPKYLVDQKQKAYKTLLDNQIANHMQPGLVQLLIQLRANGYKVAIASGSAREEIAAVIKALNIDNFIDIYISAEDKEVKRGKPHPDIFSYAADKLRLRNEECLVLEDADKGINAAMKARMLRYAIASRETKEHLFLNATRQLSSLSQVWHYLQIDTLN